MVFGPCNGYYLYCDNNSVRQLECRHGCGGGEGGGSLLHAPEDTPVLSVLLPGEAHQVHCSLS